MRPDFEEVYLHAIKRGLLVTVFSNGTLVTDRIADLPEIRTHEDLAAGEQKEETALIGHFVHQTEEARGVEFSGLFLGISGRLVHIAMDATEIASKRGLHRPVHRDVGAGRAKREGAERPIGYSTQGRG